MNNETSNISEPMAENPLLAAVLVHAHPIVELCVENMKKDENGCFAECIIYNREFGNKVESSFFLTESVAEEIKKLMQLFIDNCR